jgi:transcriptional regulator of arginine metabolism
MKATQATVSRDVRELGLRKYTGGYYAIAEDRHVRKMFQELVTSVVPAQNLVVVKTSTGIAQGVAAALDASKRGEVIGTIAGDDTIILVCEDNDRATEVARLLDAYRT